MNKYYQVSKRNYLASVLYNVITKKNDEVLIATKNSRLSPQSLYTHFKALGIIIKTE